MSSKDDDRQLEATNPVQSAWVTANAGSGKTHVLVNRIARLLLNGSAPDRLLCLTFTKAAASEMSTRLFEQLGRWALMPDPDLRQLLNKLCGREVDAELVLRARRLFAEALESPGGLRIQTIHAFCERLLKRFPLEANVAPQFSVLDEAATEELLTRARDNVLRSSALGSEALSHSISELTEHGSDQRFDELIRKVIAERSWVEPYLAENRAHGIEFAVRGTLGLASDANEAQILLGAMTAFTPADALKLAGALKRGGKRDVVRGDFSEAYGNNPVPQTFLALLTASLTQDGEVPKALATKAVFEQSPFAESLLQKLTSLAVDVRAKRNALMIARSTSNLLCLADAILLAYRDLKQFRSALDYDDLINKTAALFKSPGAYWVLYKLDGGIDHILVDEAQDTSPNQWAIVRAIADEFFAGLGAERRVQAKERTVFAVGDIKQSIMSFQGARPLEFVRSQKIVAARAGESRASFEHVKLQKSFRSAPRILELVDAVFSDPEAADGVLIEERAQPHEAHRSDIPGLVEVWPLVEAPEKQDALAWDAPRDRVTADHPVVTLASRIAGKVKEWIGAGVPIFDKEEKVLRPINAGDVMVLVRRRGLLASEIIRQLKRLSIPVAGADRLVLADHIAVMDLIAVGRFALLPTDDLTLAVVLRGPLCGLSDDDLFELAYGRDQASIWSVIQAKADDARWSDAFQFLSQVWKMADHVQPYEFYSHILSAMGGWQKILSRLGFDAADPIEEFLSAAIEFGISNTPSLEAFLHSVEHAETEIKRDQDRGEGAVRVLTVHGSKGLEAPVVILPDTFSTPEHGRHDGELLQADGTPLWKIKSEWDETVRSRARADGREERLREYRRLLYVALTRARDQLYICGYQPERDSGSSPSWYELVERAMKRLNAKVYTDEFGGNFYRYGELPSTDNMSTIHAKDLKLVLQADMPSWAFVAAPEERARRRATPSQPVKQSLGVTRSVREGLSAMDRGTAVHRILEAVAQARPEKWSNIAHDIARAMLAPFDVQAVVSEALRVRRDPTFARLFDANSYGEVPISGTVDWRGKIFQLPGRFDRVVVENDSVTVIEFKTDRVVPKADSSINPTYLRQLVLYRYGLKQLFPEKPISCAILWTAEPRLSVVPSDLLDEYEHVLDPDDGGS